MSPTINKKAERSILVLDKISPLLGLYKPLKNDVVVYLKPSSHQQHLSVVKRVVGTPGDLVAARNGKNLTISPGNQH